MQAGPAPAEAHRAHTLYRAPRSVQGPIVGRHRNLATVPLRPGELLSPAERARRLTLLRAALAGTAPAFDARRILLEQGGQS